MNLTQHLGDYVLSEQLRQDRTGTVYRGVHATSKEQVTVKVLHAKQARDPDLVARFKREASTLRRIKHSGVLEVLDHGESDQGLYLVMENLVGESLADRLKRKDRLSLPETQRIVGVVASALATAHRMRIVHRDLTADSIFLAEMDADYSLGHGVKLLDLGIAKILGDQVVTSSKEVDQRADIQALGRLAYQMLAGQPPVQGSSQDSGPVTERKRPARLSAHGVTVPSSVEGAIMKALERKKKRRFSSMAEFARAMGVVIPPAAPPPPASSAVVAPLASASGLLAPVAVAPHLGRVSSLIALVSPRVTRVREAFDKARQRPRTVAVVAAATAAVFAIGWFGLRSGGQPDTVAGTGALARAVDVARVPPPVPGAPSSAPSSTPSRVGEILALNQKAVTAYGQSDVKSARALLQQADKLAITSGYKDAPVRAQTQVRLGALFVGQKNPRVGRRYLAKAVAINPAVRVPASMMTPQVNKALNAARGKARIAKSAAAKNGMKRGLKSHPARRRGRDLKRTL